MNTASSMYRRFLLETADRTGKSADQWKALLQTNGFTRHAERLRWLQEEQGLPYRVAYLLASHADETRPDYTDEAGLVSAMYAGAKAALRPLHDLLTELVMMTGPGVTASVAKTMVTFRRKHVFAQVKPATQSRIDFGLALPRIEDAPTRIVATGGLEKGDRISYRIGVSRVDDIDADLQGWLERAYRFTAAG